MSLAQTHLEELLTWLNEPEGTNFEFKEAKQNFHITDDLKARVAALVESGAVESIGRGKGTRYILSKTLYAALGGSGVYTRKRGLDHETKKTLIEKHLRDRREAGAALSELHQVLPAESESAVQRLLGELRAEGRVELRGARRWARWMLAKAKAQGNEPAR